jgi:HEAT repeat protein
LSIVGIGLAAILACGARSPEEKAIADQIENLEPVDYDQYRETITALARLGEPAVEPLIKGLTNRDAGVRCGCAEAMGQIGDERAIGPLIERTNDRYDGLQQIAGEVLWGMTGVNHYDDYERWKRRYREEYRSQSASVSESLEG